jgi:hypothetical protein
MTHTPKIRDLLTAANGDAQDPHAREAHIAARFAWLHETIAAHREAQRKVDDAWGRIFDSLPDDLDEEELAAIPPPPEQAELHAICDQIQAVRDHDLWPRHLYWSV